MGGTNIKDPGYLMKQGNGSILLLHKHNQNIVALYIPIHTDLRLVSYSLKRQWNTSNWVLGARAVELWKQGCCSCSRSPLHNIDIVQRRNFLLSESCISAVTGLCPNLYMFHEQLGQFYPQPIIWYFSNSFTNFQYIYLTIGLSKSFC